MEAFVTSLLAFPPKTTPPHAEYDKLIKGTLKLLNSAPAKNLKQPYKGVGLLEVFDPSIHSLPYLFVLLASVQSTDNLAPGSPLWDRITAFLRNFDPVQIRYAGQEWRRLMEDFGRAAEATGNAAVAIEPLRASLLHLDPHSSTLTTCHVQFLRLCLLARAFDAAVPVLQGSIFHFPAAEKAAMLPLPCAHHATSSTYITNTSGLSSKLSYADALLYHLYGGMVFLGTKDWNSAIQYLELAMAHPVTQHPSLMQVEAYKKWILAHLLKSGKMPNVPREVSSLAARHFHTLAKPYENLGDAFKNSDPTKLQSEIEMGQEAWRADCNTGLVLQVLAAHQRLAIDSLSRTYTSLPLSILAQLDVTKGRSAADVQDYLQGLIAVGQLDAELTLAPEPAQSILRFRKGSTNGDNEVAEGLAVESKLVAAKQRCEALNRHMDVAQRRMELSKEYIELERKVRKHKAEGGDMLNGLNGALHSQATEHPDEDALEEL